MSPVSCSVGDPYIGYVMLQYRIRPLLLSITELEELFRASSIFYVQKMVAHCVWFHLCSNTQDLMATKL